MKWWKVDYHCPKCGHHPVHMNFWKKETEPRYMCTECNFQFDMTPHENKTERTVDEP